MFELAIEFLLKKNKTKTFLSTELSKNHARAEKWQRRKTIEMITRRKTFLNYLENVLETKQFQLKLKLKEKHKSKKFIYANINFWRWAGDDLHHPLTHNQLYLLKYNLIIQEFMQKMFLQEDKTSVNGKGIRTLGRLPL